MARWKKRKNTGYIVSTTDNTTLPGGPKQEMEGEPVIEESRDITVKEGQPPCGKTMKQNMNHPLEQVQNH